RGCFEIVFEHPHHRAAVAGHQRHHRGAREGRVPETRCEGGATRPIAVGTPVETLRYDSGTAVALVHELHSNRTSTLPRHRSATKLRFAVAFGGTIETLTMCLLDVIPGIRDRRFTR